MRIRISLSILLSLAFGCGLNTQGDYFPWGDGDVDAPQDARDGDAAAEGDRPDFEIPETCGNGRVDDGEECDDGNGIDGDGCDVTCRFSCHVDADCADAEPCNGIEWCNTDAHTCAPGTSLPPGSTCDDGQFCTASSECDDGGHCLGAGYRCDDGWVCTRDDCNETADTCDNGLLADTCLIDGACYNVGDVNPVNGCMECRPEVGINAWTLAADRKPCTDISLNPGLCCTGACRPAAQCCTSGDCTAACTGAPMDCSLIGAAGCSYQVGCAWASGEGCWGVHSPCNMLDDDACGHCSNGCWWNSSGCAGTAGGCTAYTDDTDCDHCGCSWGTYAFCSGSAWPCSSFMDEGACLLQVPCVWGSGVCGADFQCH